jgi:hypothetical protein
MQVCSKKAADGAFHQAVPLSRASLSDHGETQTSPNKGKSEARAENGDIKARKKPTSTTRLLKLSVPVPCPHPQRVIKNQNQNPNHTNLGLTACMMSSPALLQVVPSRNHWSELFRKMRLCSENDPFLSVLLLSPLNF